MRPVRASRAASASGPSASSSHVYFPIGVVISLVTSMEDGTAVELATVGREGMVGLPVFLGTGSLPIQAFGQIPGEALRVTAEAFRAEIKRNGPLVQVLNRYMQALFIQVAQVAACNRVHLVEQRRARWLLQTHDRVGADQFLLTQEFLAQMLGVRRAGVSVAAGLLQKAGLIRYARGRITILDRPGQESAACECYRVVRREFDRLLRWR
jgi:CRP-like cAMP-binding protein